jgi:hypothetical protein
MPQLTVTQARELIARYAIDHPELSFKQIGEHFGYTGSYVQLILKAKGLRRKRSERPSRINTDALAQA